MCSEPNWRGMRESIIGLGDSSLRKSFYPELRRRLEELEDAQQRLRLSEQNLRSVFEHTNDGIIIHNLDGRVLEVNAAVLRMFRISSEDIRHLAIPDFLAPVSPHEDPYIAVQKHWRRTIELGHYSVEILARRPGDESTFDAEVGLDLCSWNGEQSVVAIVRDITERKRLEGMLRQSQKLDALGQLAGGIAHDTNNMLGVIIGYTEMLLANESLGEDVLRDLGQILKAAHRSGDLARQLLAFARKQSIQPRAIDLDQVIESSLSMLRRLITENIHLEWEPNAHPWTVWMDPSQVDQILANLAVNARDAIHEQGRIRLSTSRKQVDETYCFGRGEAHPGDYLVLSVSDDGIGMSQEILAHIFEPFFTTKGLGRGTGLGLATVYGIVGQNNGFITVYSELGHGTTFRLHFPRHLGAIETELPSEEELQRGDETILVVEDEPSLLELTERLLVGAGYRILTSNSPRKAIELAHECSHPIHLLLTDLVMPEMDGKCLLSEISACRPHIRGLFMSGYPADTLSKNATLTDSVPFLQKPFSQRDLLRFVRRTLDA